MQMRDFHFSVGLTRVSFTWTHLRRVWVTAQVTEESSGFQLVWCFAVKCCDTQHNLFLGKPVFPPVAGMNVCLFLTSSRHFPLNWQASRVQRPQCVFHGKRTVTLFRPNQPAKGLCLFHLIEKSWLVVFIVSLELSEMFRLMFVVNSWVYLVYRHHFVIVRHHRNKNAEQVLLFLWHKRGWFWPFVCTYRHLCLNPLTYVCVFYLFSCICAAFPPSLSDRHTVSDVDRCLEFDQLKGLWTSGLVQRPCAIAPLLYCSCVLITRSRNTCGRKHTPQWKFP